ncbi:MAG: putative Ig domain-containing protein, partial [Sphingorhabdus sp.]
LVSLEDFSFAEPMSSYMFDRLRRDVTYSVTLSDGNPAPAWIKIYQDPATGEAFVAGTPPENYFGYLDLQITGSVGLQSGTASFRLTVDPVNDAPKLVSLYEDQFVNAGNFQFALPAGNFTDVESDAITLSVSLADGSPLPSWLTFDGSNVSGQSPAGFEGLLEILVEASDGNLSTATVFSLVVEQSSNAAPELTSPLSDQNFAEDSLVDFVIAANAFTDPNGDPLTYSATMADGTALPTWLSFDGNCFLGTPPTDFNGPLDIRIIASDGELSASDEFRLAIAPVNDAPISVTLSNNAIAENSAAGAVVGTLAAADVDSADTHSFQLLATQMRLDDALRLDPSAPVPIGFTGTDAGQNNTGLRLTSMGRYAGTSAQGAYTVWRIRNTNSTAQTVRLNASSGGFDKTITVDPMTDTYVLSSNIAGSATHRLYRATTLIDTKASSAAAFTSSTQVSLVNPMFEIVGDQLVVRAGANLDFERIAAVSLTVGATDAAGASITQTFQVNIGDVADYNVMTGTAVANTLTGTAFADDIRGLDGNDTLTGAGGNDILNGGSGTDTIVMAGLQSSYTIQTVNGSIRITDNQTTVDGDDGTDTLSAVERIQFKNGVIQSIVSPVILDLNGDGVALVNADRSKAKFDWDGDGKRDKTGWISKGDGLLVLDRNGDGRVSGANEMSFLDDKLNAKSDLDGLTSFDSNGDGVLSAQDNAWGSFRIWRDNGDGKQGKGELVSLEQAGVAAINLTSTATNQNWGWGDNITVNTGQFTRNDGTIGALSDVALSYKGSAKAKPASNPLAALRAGLNYDFGSGEPESVPSADSSLTDFINFTLARIVQDMTVFGAKTGESEGLRQSNIPASYDYFM